MTPTPDISRSPAEASGSPDGIHIPDGIPIRMADGTVRVKPGSTLADLVRSLGHEPARVGTSINGEFVSRSARDRVLCAGDEVLLFEAIVGG